MSGETSTVFVVDDDPLLLMALKRVLRSTGYEVETFESADMFLNSVAANTPGCLLLDVAMPGLSGLQVQQLLLGSPAERPIIFLSGKSDIRLTVHAMKSGAVDFLTKPVDPTKLLAAVAEAVRRDAAFRRERAAHLEIRDRLALLTRREKEVFDHVVHGRLNKQIAADLGTAEKTVKVHRARVMKKMRVRTLADLVLIAYVVGVVKPPQFGTAATQDSLLPFH
jgi:FixJ family two-component response regulator